ILGSKRELHKAIKQALKTYKRAFKVERKTELINEVAKDYVEHVVEEDIYVLIDRFGYAKSIDSNAYSKADESTIAEYRQVIQMKNTDTLCFFTSNANMYRIKVSAIPKGRIRDKGVLIHSLCKMGNEEAIFFIPFEELFESQLVFVTKNGYVKRVSGIEFETGRSQISSSKLEDGDEIILISSLSTEEVIMDSKRIFFLTNDHFTLCYPISEVNEYKKTSRGVTGIKLGKDDYVKAAYVLGNTDKSVVFNEKELGINRFKEGKRADKGKKIRL
nr:hypothetical protein [Lachnospiraceae bacterium]